MDVSNEDVILKRAIIRAAFYDHGEDTAVEWDKPITGLFKDARERFAFVMLLHTESVGIPGTLEMVMTRHEDVYVIEAEEGILRKIVTNSCLVEDPRIQYNKFQLKKKPTFL